MRCGWRLGSLSLLVTLGVLVGLSLPADAHEQRKVGGYIFRVGWADEPTYAGFKNGVQLELKDSSGKPVTDLPEGLKVEIIFGTQKMGPLALEAAFGKSFGTPGDFRAAVVPTRPGNYTFHFVGSLDSQRVDESFTSSDKTFDPVVEASEIEFPAKDPSPGELAGLLERTNSRIASIQISVRDAASAASQGRMLGAIGIVTGLAGLVVALRPSRRGPSGRDAQ